MIQNMERQVLVDRIQGREGIESRVQRALPGWVDYHPATGCLCRVMAKAPRTCSRPLPYVSHLFWSTYSTWNLEID
jgi:hypothetical protein